MKKQVLFLFASLLIIFQAEAQLIIADPPFPTDQDEVIITFNAQEGNGGLAGYSGNVYAHTGVITNNSSGGSDWKYVKADWGVNIPDCKLVSVGEDLWQFTLGPSIRNYYNVPANETILQLAFVFRSEAQVGGSWLEGKTAEGGDIYYDVFSEGLAVIITLPAERPVLASVDDMIHIEGNSNMADSTFLYIDNMQVYADTGATFSHEHHVVSDGKHWVKAVAKNTSGMVADSFYYYVRPPVIIEDVPNGIVDGINYLDDETVILSLYAPEKDYVFVLGDFGDWQLDNAFYMKRSTDGKRYWVELSGLEPGKEYIYQYFIDGELRVGDSYADKVSDPWNDHYIDAATYPNMIAYPAGKTSGIATVFQTAQEDYEWEVTDFQPPANEDLVIYELLIRDFTDQHTYNSTLVKLDYLQEMGVNAIELMPPSEFEGNNSWGYNPNYYFAVDKYYGPKNTFKAFIDECHKRGIAVIQDMVLNHCYNTNPMVMMYWDAANNRPAANSPWFNTVSPNPVFSWGSDFNHESQDTKDFIDRVNKYWLEEYKVDGYRFDFTKGFTNTPGDGGGYDASRIAILKRMADEIYAVKSDAIIILEHFAPDNEERELSAHGMLIWGNMNYNYNEGTMGYNDGGKSNFNRVSYKSRGYSDPHLVGYMESHDEERLAYKNVTYGNENDNYSTQDTITSLHRNEMAAAFFLTVPGPKMIWQFGELGYDYSINYCEDGSINESCRTHPKPIRWDYYDQVNRKRLYQIYGALNHLKQTEPAFKTENFTMSTQSSMKSIKLTHNDMNVCIIGNFGMEDGDITPHFQETGIWFDFFSGDSLEVTQTSQAIELQAGEYRIYTTKRLQKPDVVGFLDHDDESKLDSFEIYPNPSTGHISVNLELKYSMYASLRLVDIQGREISHLFKGELQKGHQTFDYNLQTVDSGFYFVLFEGENQHFAKKLIVR